MNILFTRLLDSNNRRGCICCLCKKPFAKYLVTTENGTMMYCNRCITQIEKD